MIKLYFVLIVCITTFQCLAQATPQRLDSLLTTYAKQKIFNGSVLVAKNGSIILEKGYGVQNIKDNQPNTANTIYQIGSITKQFTSAIILQLVSKNKMSLQDKLSKYFPDYPKGDSITVEHLLTHTSGIYNYTNDGDFMKTRSERPIPRDSLLWLFENKPLNFSPGTKYDYSNSGYILLGMIIEKVTGKSYFRVVRQNIFEPLGMNHTGFDFTDLKSNDKAIGYSSDLSQAVGIVDSSVSFAAGAIYTTVGDLYKWDRALYTDRIVPQALLQKAFTSYKASYGYGWQIGNDYNKKAVQHGGGITGFVSYILRVPQDQICIIAISNVPSASTADIAREIEGIFYGKMPEPKAERKEIHVPADTLKLYTGVYRLAPNFDIAITLENDTLFAQATGQGKNPLFAERINFFFLKVVDAQAEFIYGSNGKIDHFILYQAGQKIEAKKINSGDTTAAPASTRKEISVDSNVLRSYVGLYELSPAFKLTITLEGGVLMAQATGQGKNILYAEKENFFFLKVVDAQVEFFPGADKKTDHLVLYQNGMKVEGKKLQ
jgi:CubicO group peptidase (beta-lactamase class C family)